MFIYNYETKQLIEKRSFYQNTVSSQIKSNIKLVAIRYSLCGNFIFIGCSNGYLLILNPVQLTLTQDVMQQSSSRIDKISFSSTNTFCAYTVN